MDRDREDEQLEVLDDARNRGGGQSSAPPTLPPLDLTAEVGDAAPPAAAQVAPASFGRGWVAAVAVFVIGVLVGGYVWSARTEAAYLAAEAERVALVAGWFNAEWSRDRGPTRLTVSLHNAGSRDVTVRSVRPDGWVAGGRPARPDAVTIAAGEWADAEIPARPTCPSAVPDRLLIEAQTEQGESSLAIPLPQQGELDRFQSLMCGEFDAFNFVAVTGIQDISPAGPRTLHMVLVLLVHSPAREEIEITAVSASGAGFRGTSSWLPISMPAGGEAPVSIAWHIDSCAATRELGELAVDVEFNNDSGTSLPALLPNRAIAALSRFAVAECGP